MNPVNKMQAASTPNKLKMVPLYMMLLALVFIWLNRSSLNEGRIASKQTTSFEKGIIDINQIKQVGFLQFNF